MTTTSQPDGEAMGLAAGPYAAASATSMDLRLCARCLEWKAPDQFHNSRTGQFSYCRDCRNSYDRRYYAERGRSKRLERKRSFLHAARAWMADLKQGVPCTDCGNTFPIYVMHWDHLPQFEKVAAISVMVGSRKRGVILAELAKCELVCANCHVTRTVRRATKTL